MGNTLRLLAGGVDDLLAERYRRLRFPAELDRISRLQKASEDLARGGEALLAFCNKLTDADAVAKAEASEQAAQCAALI